MPLLCPWMLDLDGFELQILLDTTGGRIFPVAGDQPTQQKIAEHRNNPGTGKINAPITSVAPNPLLDSGR
jgi:hypothetical protein